MRSSHSEKTRTTLDLMGAPHTGWRTPDIKWVLRERLVATKVPCPTCRGTGQVPKADPGVRNARERCPECPPRRLWPNYGTGVVWRDVLRPVLVGEIQWPQGTEFRSRFRSGSNCALCNKRILSPISWRPVLGTAHDGTPLGMWVGDECNRKVLGVEEAELVRNEDGTVWREQPKEKKPSKPKPPALEAPPSKDALDAVVQEAFGDLLWDRTTLENTRATSTYHFTLEKRDRNDFRLSYEVILNVRFGCTVRPYWGDNKPLLKDRECFDAVEALRRALPAIRKHAGL